MRAFKPAVLAAAAIGLMPASAGAALPFGNLVLNPGAEAGAGATGDGVTPPPSWSVVSNFTVVQYGGSGFSHPSGAKNFFAGGPGNAQSSAAQDVDVSAAAAEIDTGNVQLALSADLAAGYGTNDDDTITVTATALPSDTVFLTAVPPTEAEAPGVTFLSRGQTAAIPAGTRAVRVTMTANRSGGNYNDGYADNVSLSFPAATAPQPAPTGAKPPAFGPTGVIAGLPSTKNCISRRSFRIRLRQRRGRVYQLATVFVNGRRVKVVRGARLTAAVDLRGLPKGRFTVKIVVITTSGEVIQGTRRYRTCTKKQRGGNRSPV